MTPRAGDSQTALDRLAAEISAETEIRLEHEAEYEWIAFVPQRNTDPGALTKYIGRSTDVQYKYRGIECRQRSTPEFISEAQKQLIKVFDETRNPEAVCGRLARLQRPLFSDDVDPNKLVTEIRISKDPAEYTPRMLTMAALERATALGLDQSAGQTVDYIVVDDTKQSAERVRLSLENPTGYDPDYDDRELIRAATSVLSPSGWSEDRIRQHLSDTNEPRRVDQDSDTRSRNSRTDNLSRIMNDSDERP